MEQLDPKKNYYLLNQEKKDNIMKELRKEIDKQKQSISINTKQNTQNDNKKYYQDNNSNFIDNKEESEDNEEREHQEILNNANLVLKQIQEDINKFSKTYGIQNILGQNQDQNNFQEVLKNKDNNNLYDNKGNDEYEDNVNYDINDNEQDDYENNYDEESDNNVEYNDDYSNIKSNIKLKIFSWKNLNYLLLVKKILIKLIQEKKLKKLYQLEKY